MTGMHTIELTDDELRIVRNALRSYLEDFGHEEADILRATKQLLAKFPPQAADYERPSE
jgi:UDP-N-acetylmuramyl pentapeptide synthase